MFGFALTFDGSGILGGKGMSGERGWEKMPCITGPFELSYLLTIFCSMRADKTNFLTGKTYFEASLREL